MRWYGMDSSGSDRDQWTDLLNKVVNLRVHKMLENSWVAELLAASEEQLSSMELVSQLFI
jgi:hypothetical protein